LTGARVEGLDWQTQGSARFANVAVPSGGKTGFAQLDPTALGIQFTNRLTDELIARNSNLMNGSGVALGDVDGDGLCDIYLCRLEGGSVLYRNLGDWKFGDVTEKAGVACVDQFTRGAVFADIDGDGDLDLIVTGLGRGARCFMNDGRGRFTEATQAAGLGARTGSTSLALADVDGDGTLDLYVANFGEVSILRDGGQVSVRTVNGQTVVTGRYANRLRIINGEYVEFGEPDGLYLNDGKGRFKQVPWEEGAFLNEDGRPVKTPWDFGLSVQMRDLNGDGFPDIYVCNDFHTPDRVWLGDGRGHFRALPRLAMRKMSYASMGVDFADIDRDGRFDFIVAEMMERDPRVRLRQSPGRIEPVVIGEIENQPQVSHNTLFWNRGDGTFAEIAHFAGVAASDWSWTPVFLDVDLDGFEDLLVTNGHTHEMNDLDTIDRMKSETSGTRRQGVLRFPRRETANAAFRNRGDLTFEETGAAWGFDSKRISHGLALADLDNDGDLDVVVNCLNAPPLILRNESVRPRLAVRLRGLPPNTRGVGAAISVLGGAVPMQGQEMICGGRYLSGDDSIRTFAAGSLTNDLSVEVRWRSGRFSRVEHARAGRIYEIDEAGAVMEARNPVAGGQRPAVGGTPIKGEPLFQDVSDRLNHVHHEEPFDDFSRQPLLPERRSQNGPGVAWFDLDGDGHDELVVGGGRGGEVAVFKYAGGKFDRIAGAKLPDDSAGITGWSGVNGRRTLFAALSRYETSDTNAPVVLGVRWNGLAAEAGPVVGADAGINPGALAVADIDGDGELDLFIGGQGIPGRHPQASRSLVLRARNGELQIDPERTRAVAGLGIVTGAIFTDVNGDGRPDLVAASSPGSLTVFLNTGGTLQEATRRVGLVSGTGLWTGVAAGDFDGDGRMDIVAGNWGLNSSRHCDERHPLHFYSADPDNDGVPELVEAQAEPPGDHIFPILNLLRTPAAALFKKGHPMTHRAFTEMSVTELFAGLNTPFTDLPVTTLTSALFLNRGDHFERVPLPREAQFAPVFGLAVADMDGDGNEDLFLSQNFFATRPEGTRLDAGRGLLLRGDGRGGLASVPSGESGVAVDGEQRGAALGDFDGDGRTDLVVTQNGAATKLFRNVTATPGLRVRLKGPPGNPDAIGAVIRLKSGERFGPAREIQAGSGWWSQNSVVPVLATPAMPDGIWIRWPGGKTTTTVLPQRALEISVDGAGALMVLR
jgi:hypothetical protein